VDQAIGVPDVEKGGQRERSLHPHGERDVVDHIVDISEEGKDDCQSHLKKAKKKYKKESLFQIHRSEEM
jgi:hypothetical protein